MRFSYEFKRKCVEMYRQGVLPDIPEGISKSEFQHQNQKWTRIEEAQESDALKRKGSNKVWTPEEKLFLVSKVIARETNKSVALNAGISDRMLYQLVRKYKIYGYNRLISKQKRRKLKDANMKKMGTRKPPKTNE